MIGDQIKALRKTLDLTQQAFCERIGIKRNTIAKYETGRGEPIDAVVSLICREFGVSEEWLRTGNGKMFKEKETDALDILASEYGMSQSDRILIEKFLSLKPEHRQAVMQYAIDVAAAFNSLENTVTVSGQIDPKEKMSVEEAEAVYIKSRLDAAQKTGPSVLNTLSDTITG